MAMFPQPTNSGVKKLLISKTPRYATIEKRVK
jgi:hypothetical protein